MSERDDLTAAERAALRRLRRDAPPPPALEAKLIARLRETGGIRAGRVPLVPAVAAALLLLLSGFVAGRATAPRAPVTEDGGYALLLLAGPQYRPAPVGAREARVQEYVAWAGQLRAQERLVLAHELAPGGVRLEPDGRSATGGLAALQGLFLVRAASAEEALSIARASPHLRYGGIVEVRALR